jgi:hypothetical protein
VTKKKKKNYQNNAFTLNCWFIGKIHKIVSSSWPCWKSGKSEMITEKKQHVPINVHMNNSYAAISAGWNLGWKAKKLRDESSIASKILFFEL